MRWGHSTFLGLCLLWACGSEEAPAPIVILSGSAELHFAPDGRSFELWAYGQKKATFPTDAFQLGLLNQLSDALSYDPYWLEHSDELFQPSAPPDLRFRSVESSVIEAEAQKVTLRQSYTGGAAATVVFSVTGDRRFKVEWVPVVSTPIAYLRLRSRANDAAYYGLGEWPDGINHKGKLRPMQMEPDLSVESANTENHVPIPLLLGTDGWGVFVESRRQGIFDVARKEADLIEITYGTAEASTAGLIFYLFAEERPLDLTRHYYQITGQPKLPARWAYGPLIWRDENRDQAEVLDDVRKIRELDLPTSGIWIDRPYARAVNTFDFEPTKFPDPAAMVQAAHAAGLRVALWHTPYLETTAEPYRTQAVQAGYFVPQPGLRLNGWSDPIDFTNPAATAFWKERLRGYAQLGIEGYKLDYAEDVLSGLGGARAKWGFFDGSSELTMHDGYTRLYHQTYAATLPNEGYFLLCRAARWGSQVYGPVIWPGDLDADFTKYRERATNRAGDVRTAVGGLPTSLNFALGLGPSGFPFYGADTGGYRHSPPDAETFIRWFQQTTFSTVMQVGDSSSQPPWVYTEENGRDQSTLDLYRIYARIHLRLFPYVWSYASQLANDGRAIMRPLGLAHPELGVHPADTYLFGEHLLIAPVLERGQRAREVQFPGGTWYSWGTGHAITATPGETRTIDAPLELIPVFIRAGGIVPMLEPHLDTLSPATDPGVDSFATDPGRLVVWLAANEGEASRFTVYDGTVIEQSGALDLKITPGTVFTKGVRFELYGMAPSSVKVDGEVLPPVSGTVINTVEQGWVGGDPLSVIVLPPGAHTVELR
jgi:alpha-D-xyloside xylohydrolase